VAHGNDGDGDPQRVVLYKKADAIAIVRLNRPRVHNALSPDMIRTLAKIWQDIGNDRDVRVAIVTGEGPSFCAGMDLKATDAGFGNASGEADPLAALPGERRRVGYVPPPTLYKPLIAAIRGVAVGGGLELALGCDIRIAAYGSRMGVPEVTRGLVPGSGGLYWLPRMIGLNHAMELLLMGELIDAERAAELGLVNRLVARDDLMLVAMDIARKIATNAPLAVQGAKEAVWRGLGASVSEGMELGEHQARLLRMTEDCKEGALAFREKRSSNFKGR
jgi:enoyl-CoA hydratase/carnithine racemase